ncbi:MAG: hypothetical protein ACOZQL_40990 [Myxococcota bacterium]
MDLVVIGGSGRVGAQLVAALRAEGHAVRALSRRSGFELLRPETWAAGFEGARRAFYLTPREVPRPDELGAEVFRALRRAGVERVVNLTGLGVDRAKGSALFRLEQALEASGLAFTHVRPNYFLQSLCEGALREGIARRDELAVAAGEARVSYVDIRELAAVCAAALTRDGLEGRGLDVTGPAGLTHEELAGAISRATGRRIRYRALSEAEARAAASAEGLSAERLEARLAFQALLRKGAFAAVSPHVEEVLGRPGRTVDEFAREAAASWAREAA